MYCRKEDNQPEKGVKNTDNDLKIVNDSFENVIFYKKGVDKLVILYYNQVRWRNAASVFVCKTNVFLCKKIIKPLFLTKFTENLKCLVFS